MAILTPGTTNTIKEETTTLEVEPTMAITNPTVDEVAHQGKVAKIGNKTIKKMQKKDLMEELRKRGCAVHRNKQVLSEQLQTEMKEKKPILSAANQQEAIENKKGGKE